MIVETRRHIAKTISYRAISSLSGFLVFYVATGNLKIGASITLAEFLYKPFVYFLHERTWYKFIKFGLKK